MFCPLCFFIHGTIKVYSDSNMELHVSSAMLLYPWHNLYVSLAKYEHPNALTSGQLPRVFHVDDVHEAASGEGIIKHIRHITQVGYEDTVKPHDRLLKETLATSSSGFKTA